MTSREIRQQFLDFFAGKDHTIVPSSPVVPHDDPTLMFTNAGMNQFKDVFLATGSRPYKRAADTQKCIRAGGKHNDLDDVGQDTYHHTFFEMLGNWSFGDYFKKEAIRWAWELLTDVWGIDKSRLHATYFEGDAGDGLEPDDEAACLWREATDIDPANIHPGNKKDNFWEMGDTGPCGPCSEIHIDRTPDRSGAPLVNAGDPRVIEIWNLVFIQFNRGSDRKLTPLPAKHVDTGMGFERICAVLAGKNSNYDTDVWTPILDAIQERTGASAYAGFVKTEPAKPSRDREGADTQDRATLMRDVSYRVIADHVRCLTLALTDGAVPGNEGRGYVLRRILRRAVRYGRQYFDVHEPFLCDLVPVVVDHMADAFPELRTAHGGNNVERVKEIIRDEEASFLKTVGRGIDKTEEEIADQFRKAVCAEKRWVWQGTALPARFMGDYEPEARDALGPNDYAFWFRKPDGTTERIILQELHARAFARYTQAPIAVSGEAAFRLHDTYGFPIDLTELMAEERGLTVDIGEYERLMEQARELARSATKVIHPSIADHFDDDETKFVGHGELTCETAVENLLTGEGLKARIGELRCGQSGALVLWETPFYAEQGGQVGDVGRIVGIGEDWEFAVSDTQKVGMTHIHRGKCVRGTIHHSERSGGGHIREGGELPPPAPRPTLARAIVSERHRRPTMQNHTVTHMLNWALREVLCAPDERRNPHVQQKGSLVDPEKTRFDFSHNKPLTIEEITRVEQRVNKRIEAGQPVYAKEVEQDKARQVNTLRAVFGEKYGDKVRVVSIGAEIGEEGQEDPNTLLGNPRASKWREYPIELCGGTHLRNTGEAERFVLIAEESVAKGIRRVVGITGEAARQAEAAGAALLEQIKTLESESAADLADALAAFQREVNESTIPIRIRHELQQRAAELQKTAKQAQKKQAAASGEVVMDRVADLLASAETVGGVTVVVGDVPAAKADALRGAIDWVRNKTEASAVLLATATEGKVTLIAGMSRDVVGKGLKAGDLIKEVAPIVGGKGGGRPDMAQGGGSKPDAIPEVVKHAREWIRARLG